MGSEEFADRVAALAALADPIRRELYLFVAAQPQPVSRDRAAEGVAVPRHTAKFHLDKLVAQGFLDTEFQRLSGRQGPGAGRPTKLYRRSGRELSVTLPERRYDLAGRLLAQAIDDSVRSGTPVLDALHTAAARLGGTLGDQVRRDLGPQPGPERRVRAVCTALAVHGYEPRCADATIALANCPFDALARDHTVIPVWRDLLADFVTPVAAFARLTGDGPGFLLECVDRGERWSRYSFVGRNPLATLVSRDGALEVRGDVPDGLPTDPTGRLTESWHRLVPVLAEEQRARRFRLYAIGVGGITDMGESVLRAFAPKFNARLQGFPFRELLQMMSASANAEQKGAGDEVFEKIFSQFKTQRPAWEA